MADLLLSLLPVAVAMAMTLGRFLAPILLLHTRQAVLTSLAFIAGMATNMLIEGLAFALIFSITGILTSREVMVRQRPRRSLHGDRHLDVSWCSQGVLSLRG